MAITYEKKYHTYTDPSIEEDDRDSLREYDCHVSHDEDKAKLETKIPVPSRDDAVSITIKNGDGDNGIRSDLGKIQGLLMAIAIAIMAIALIVLLDSCVMSV